jgi:uncharacterized membrane protein HdeD (DUF308 family)
MLSKGERIFNQIAGILNTVVGAFLFLTFSFHSLVCLFFLQEPLPKGIFWYLSWAIFSILLGIICLFENRKNMDLVDYLIMKFKRKS